MRGATKAIPALLLLTAMLAGCIQFGPPAPFQLTDEDVELRRLQTRYFETDDERMMLMAVASLLQDTGFTLDESETDLGLIVASKNRDATDTGDIVASITLSILTGSQVPMDDEQRMRASVVTRPLGDDGGRIAVRVTFQRTVWDTQGNISHNHAMTNPDLYAEFFEKLSKSVFLEAHQI